MAEGLHAMQSGRKPLTQRLFWLWIALAFLVGLVPGLGLFLYKNNTANARAVVLLERQKELTAKVDAQDKEIAKLKAQVASAEASAAAAVARPTARASGSANSAPEIPDVPAGQIKFVTRSAEPNPASAGATIKITALVAGSATEVYMEIKSQDATISKIYKLKKGSTDGKATTWYRDDAKAPQRSGDYSLFAWGYVGKTKTVMPGVGKLTVK